ncbi:MAG TPA: hypothetical protein VN397_01640 [Candidatus Methylomirabilis sp.]|nr:hypothetical protein [Candidatus Methylomirabilis sp.]
MEFTSTRSSRYKWGNRSALPPRLSTIGRLLGKIARKHREYPGRAVVIDRLNDRIANEIGEKRGSADDVVRALMNVAILIPVTLQDGREAMLYDEAQMERAVAFESGGPTVVEPSHDYVVERARELLQPRESDQDDAGPDSGVTITEGAGGKRIANTCEPDYDEIILCLDMAKDRIMLADGAGILEDVVVNPLGVLQKAFPHMDAEWLHAHMSRAIRSRYLVPIGKDVYRVTLEPTLNRTNPGLADSEQPLSVEHVLEDELMQYRLALRKAEDALERERARQVSEREAAIADLRRQHERSVNGTCDDIRKEAETALATRRAEIHGARDELLSVLERDYFERKSAIESDAIQKLARASQELEADAECQILRITQEGVEFWSVLEERGERELADKERAELRAIELTIVEYRERISLSEKLLEKRKKPVMG